MGTGTLDSDKNLQQKAEEVCMKCKGNYYLTDSGLCESCVITVGNLIIQDDKVMLKSNVLLAVQEMKKKVKANSNKAYRGVPFHEIPTVYELIDSVFGGKK